MDQNEWDKFREDHMRKVNLMFFSYVILSIGMIGLYLGSVFKWW